MVTRNKKTNEFNMSFPIFDTSNIVSNKSHYKPSYQLRLGGLFVELAISNFQHHITDSTNILM